MLQIDTLKKGKNYFLFSKSSRIDFVSISKSKKAKDTIIYIRFGYPTPIPTSNTINGTVISAHKNKESNVPVFDKIDIIKGNYADIKVEKETLLKNLFTITGAKFPLSLKLTSGKEIIDFELTEGGEWDIRIDLKNN